MCISLGFCLKHPLTALVRGYLLCEMQNEYVWWLLRQGGLSSGAGDPAVHGHLMATKEAVLGRGHQGVGGKLCLRASGSAPPAKNRNYLSGTAAGGRDLSRREN